MIDIIILNYMDSGREENRYVHAILKHFKEEINQNEKNIAVHIHSPVSKSDFLYELEKLFDNKSQNPLIIKIISRGKSHLGGFLFNNNNSFVSYSELLLSIIDKKKERKLLLDLSSVCGSAFYFHHLESKWKTNLNEYFDYAIASWIQTPSSLTSSLNHYKLLNQKYPHYQAENADILKELADQLTGLNESASQTYAHTGQVTDAVLHRFPSDSLYEFPGDVARQILALFQQLDDSQKAFVITQLFRLQSTDKKPAYHYALDMQALEELQELWKDQPSIEELIKLLRK